jgi:hypothetical protein
MTTRERQRAAVPVSVEITDKAAVDGDRVIATPRLSITINPSQRRSASHGEAGYERRPGDSYFTEPWVTRALLQAVDFTPPGCKRSEAVIWEPACGDGRMAREIEKAGYRVVASDLHDYGYGVTGVDFLDVTSPVHANAPPTLAAIVTNPPFGDMVPRFIRRALELTRPALGKVAMLARHEFDAPKTHHPLLGSPFAAKLVLHKRPRWIDGEQKASPRFPYAWFCWSWRHVGPPQLHYLPDPDRAPGDRSSKGNSDDQV